MDICETFGAEPPFLDCGMGEATSSLSSYHSHFSMQTVAFNMSGIIATFN